MHRHEHHGIIYFIILIISTLTVWLASLKAGADSTSLATAKGMEPKFQSAVSSPPNAATSAEFDFSLSNSYRKDDLDWNIAGNRSGNNPNILSELTWDDLEIYQLKFQAKTVVPKIFYLRGSFAYGWIFDGQNQDGRNPYDAQGTGPGPSTGG